MISRHNEKRHTIFSLNQRRKTILKMIFTCGFLISIAIASVLLDDARIDSNLTMRSSPPSFDHLFGTDWLGRDMFTRTVKGLTLSIGVGLIGATCSTLIALILGMAAATMGRVADGIISWLIDLFLSVPHLITLILISFALGGGFKGIVVGIALTHWPSLARVIRAEVMQIRSADYVKISRKLGKSRIWLAYHHVLPHLIPQALVGFLLLFPHAILHEAAVTFLGMGLSPDEPAIGIILYESMKYLSTGMWWLALFPGLCLVLVVRSFDRIGEYLRLLLRSGKTYDS